MKALFIAAMLLLSVPMAGCATVPLGTHVNPK